MLIVLLPVVLTTNLKLIPHQLNGSPTPSLIVFWRSLISDGYKLIDTVEIICSNSVTKSFISITILCLCFTSSCTSSVSISRLLPSSHHSWLEKYSEWRILKWVIYFVLTVSGEERRGAVRSNDISSAHCTITTDPELWSTFLLLPLNIVWVTTVKLQIRTFR